MAVDKQQLFCAIQKSLDEVLKEYEKPTPNIGRILQLDEERIKLWEIFNRTLD